MFVNVVHSILIEFAFAVELEFDTSASRMCTWARAYEWAIFIHKYQFLYFKFTERVW